MRIRSKSELPLIFQPFELPGNFPCTLLGKHLQLDDPIRHLHVHSCLELGYCYEGAGVFMIGQKILPFRGGDVSVINNREPHLARSAEGTTSKWSWILLDTQKLIGPAFPELELLDPSVLCGDRFRNIISNSDDPEIAPLMKILIRELEMKKDGYRMTVRGIVISIMSKLHRLVKKEQVDGTPQNSTDSMERVGPALKAIIGGYHRKQSVSNLASKCGMSVANFRRIFLEATGLPRPNIC